MMISSEQQTTLIAAAVEARSRAYAPYSSYHVGAALLCDDGECGDGVNGDGEIVVGTNVENASYGLTLCAERVAVVSAVSRGRQRFKALAIATADAGAPCGACRQVLAEFGSDLPIFLIAADQNNECVETSLAELLPMQFHLRNR